MPASAARIEANRQNAQRSTGPRTTQGKQRSRANAFKHGLCAETIGRDDLEVARDRAEGLGESESESESFTFVGWLVKQVATLSLQVEHAQALQEAARDRIALRAELTWDDDRRLEATILAARLADRPDHVVEGLRQTPQGCQWLRNRWSMLAHAAEYAHGWTPEQTRLAFHLLGTPAEFREGNQPGTSIDPSGRLDGSILDPATLARREVDDLEQRLALIQAVDDADRQAAGSGLTENAEIRRLRRYEATLHRRLRWALELLEGFSSPPDPPAEAPPPEAEPTDSTPPPPKTPEARATVEGIARPTRSSTRQEHKLLKAEARREARQRRLDKLRA